MSLESSRSDIVTQITTKCGTFDMCATSATNVAQNVAQFYLYFKYKFHQWRKHGEITALEDSKAAPQKVRYQPFAKK